RKNAHQKTCGKNPNRLLYKCRYCPKELSQLCHRDRHEITCPKRPKSSSSKSASSSKSKSK
ncbi:hypothetical protein PVAND_017720, partial [Polypedilum vanderplanki]